MNTFALRLLYLVLGFAVFATLAHAAPLERFYSMSGREHEVKFRAIFASKFSDLEAVKALSNDQKQRVINSEILPLVDFLFGPLVHRSSGSPQRATSITVDWDRAELVNGKVRLPYLYKGLWIVTSDASLAKSIDLPLPFSRSLVLSPRWKSCTDSDPEHQTESFYWYFWDPTRSGCDHQEGVQYQTVRVEIGTESRLTQISYPEYDRMIADGKMSLTMAFGYVTDPCRPNPDSDYELGALEYQKYLRHVRQQYSELNETPILQGEYQRAARPDLVIGHRFTGTMNGVQVVLNVVMAAGVDQMELFAKSYAHEHDDLFAWFGHSRVGSGFDAQRFASMVRTQPRYYSISNDYQIIYWAGCNSYSYYTVPFFEQKGCSKNLDIIANGLPSYFNLNADSAILTTKNFLNWKKRGTYQALVDALEQRAGRMGATVLVNVLGDEDNAL